MALQTIPGFTGFSYARISSMDNRAVGKLTDTNHLHALHQERPADYDKKVIDIYTQSSLYSNDFQNMLGQAEPYYIDGNSDSWTWDIEMVYKFPKIIDVPTDTLNAQRVGIDGQEFEFVLDRADFYINQIITSHKMYAPQFAIVEDPKPHLSGFLYKATLISDNPKSDFVDKKFLSPGVEYQLVSSIIGEFDIELPGLPGLGEKLSMYESLGSASGVQHTITGWADDERISRDPRSGLPLDLLVFMKRTRNEKAVSRSDVRWEPFVEFLMKKQMIEEKTSKQFWQKPGTVKSRGSKQEIKKASAGIYHRMKYNGNYVSYNRGEFTKNLIRAIFGDLFYRRVDVAQRRVKLYTNEAGFDTFEQMLKEDALNSGLTLVADERFIQGSGQNMTLNFAFNSMITRETGKVDLVHLKELDLPQTNLEFGQNKKSTPVFFVFDVSPTSDGTMKGNVREVRKKGRPSMTWGYIDGRRHHLGFAASQGHSAASMYDGYTIFMDDRYDIFIEDMSRCVLIEEIPQF